MKYKVLEEFVLNGITQKLDSIIDLDYKMANLKSIQGKIEKVDEKVASADKSVLGSIVPGKPLTEEQKKKLAEENAAVSTEAHKLAAMHHAEDLKTGKGEPVIGAIASALKEKLVNEEFEKKIEGGGGDIPEIPDIPGNDETNLE